MTPHPTALLGLVLCLGPTIPAQTGHLPRPSISAEPGPVVRRGSSVTFVCRGPPSVDTFRLEKEGRSFETVCEMESHHNETEARFPIASASEHHAGRYRCIYYKRSMWSERSESLELKVADEGTTQGPPTSQALPSGPGSPLHTRLQHRDGTKLALLGLLSARPGGGASLVPHSPFFKVQKLGDSFLPRVTGQKSARADRPQTPALHRPGWAGPRAHPPSTQSAVFPWRVRGRPGAAGAPLYTAARPRARRVQGHPGGRAHSEGRAA